MICFGEVGGFRLVCSQLTRRPRAWRKEMNIVLLGPEPLLPIHKNHDLKEHDRSSTQERDVRRGCSGTYGIDCQSNSACGARGCRCLRMGDGTETDDLVPGRSQITPDNPDIQRDSVSITSCIPRPGRWAVDLDRKLQKKHETGVTPKH